MGRVLQDSSLYLLGNMAGRMVGFLAIPFYSRFLSPAQYGLIELIELSTQTIALALGLQAVGAALSRLFHDQKTRESEQAVVSTSLITTGVFSAVITVAAVASAGQLSQLVFHTDEWAGLLRAAFIAMFFSEMIEVALVYERIRNHARFFLAYSLTTLVVNLSLNILFIGFLDAGVWGFVSSKLVVTLGSCIVMLLRVRRDVGWKWRSMYVPELVKFGAPLVLSSLSYFAIHFSDRFFLSSSVSLAELGRYAMSYRFAILISALVGDSFNKSWGVTLYRYTDRPDWQQQFARVASYLTFVLFTTGLGIALFSPELLQIMVPTAYLPPPLLLPVLIASYLAREIGDFFRTLLLINKRSGLVSRIAFASAALNLAANAVLIPAYGLYGAAVATFVTWLVYMVVCWVIANREHRLPVRVRSYLLIAGLVVLVYGLASSSRVGFLPLQMVLDGLWVLVFCVAALMLFFSAAERRGILGLTGAVTIWCWTRWPAALPAAAGRESRLLLLSGSAGSDMELACRDAAKAATSGPDAAGPVTVAADGLVIVAANGPGPALTASRLSRGVDALVRALSRALPRRDGLRWLPDLYRDAAAQVQAGTVLVSAHPPLATHLGALALKHRFGLPWIAALDGPAVFGPDRFGRRTQLFDPVVERAVMAGADIVMLRDRATADALATRHPEASAKIRVMAPGQKLSELLAEIIAGLRVASD